MIFAERILELRERRLQVRHGTGRIAGLESYLGTLYERTPEMNAASRIRARVYLESRYQSVDKFPRDDIVAALAIDLGTLD